MQSVTATIDGKKYMRVTKTRARKFWEEGWEILFCPSKLYPVGGWMPGTVTSKADMTKHNPERTFEDVCKEYAYYNCNYETGRYPAFYRQISRK